MLPIYDKAKAGTDGETENPGFITGSMAGRGIARGQVLIKASFKT
jgi:hypothetical protein